MPEHKGPLDIDGCRAQDEPCPRILIPQHQMRGYEAPHGLPCGDAWDALEGASVSYPAQTPRCHPPGSSNTVTESLVLLGVR